MFVLKEPEFPASLVRHQSTSICSGLNHKQRRLKASLLQPEENQLTPPEQQGATVDRKNSPVVGRKPLEQIQTPEIRGHQTFDQLG